jgi:hypothetical protein
MAQTPIENQPKESSISHKFWDSRHSSEIVDLSALDFTGNEANVKTLLGLFLTSVNALVIDGNEANIAKVVLTDEPLVLASDGTIESPDPTKIRVAVRGPAIFKKGGLRTADHAGNSYDMAAVETALNALGITLTDDPEVTATQTAV